MELRQLKYFYKIANSETLTQAAKELHVSQPSLSGMLRKMECELGGKLFVKEGRVLRLNERGKILLKYTSQILNSMEAMQQDISLFNEKKKTQLMIELRAASQLILPVVKEFQRRHPEIKITIVQNPSARDKEEEADIIITADYKMPAGSGTLLFEEELMLVVPKGHRLEGKDFVVTEDLSEEGFILLSKGKVLREIIEYYCKRMNFTPRVILESDDLEMVKTLIRSGFGISIIPSESWQNVSGERVVEIPIADCPCKRYVFLLQKERTVASDAAKLFSEEVQNALRYLQNA